MNAYWKDLLREIKNTKGRFISLIIITMLGAASLVGIQATSIDMRDVADKTYKEKNLYDLQIKSTVGFEDDDIKALADTPEVSAVMPTMIYDSYINFDDENLPVRTYALPEKINSIDLLQGRLPADTHECAVEQDLLDENNIKIGDHIDLALDDMNEYHDVFNEDEFTVVGVVDSPLYISFERGNTALGDGTINYFLYLHPDAYKLDVYTDVYLLMNSSQNIYNLSEDYNASAEHFKDDVDKTGDIREKAARDHMADAQKKIDDGRSEYDDNKKIFEEEISDGEKKLAEARVRLDDAKTKLEDGEKELADKIKTGRAKIKKNADKLSAEQKKVDDSSAELLIAQKELDKNRNKVEATLADLAKQGPEGVSPELDAYYQQAYAALSKIDETQIELNKGKAALTAAQAKLNEGNKKIRDARRKLIREKDKAQKEIDKGWIKYYNGLGEYEDGMSELKTEEANAIRKFEKAESDLDKAQKKLDDAPVPEWFTSVRKDAISFDSYYQDTLRLEKIGYVFPLVFFLVAILVALTSMSRMVENDRTQIGIYKALGYRPSAVLMKYLIYAFCASTIGGLLGVVTGSIVFPLVIADAYGHLYEMPAVSTPIPLFISVFALVGSVATIMLITLITYIGSMRGNPAVLMRPKPPAKGKRVLLERVTVIWNRLGFFSKVTARNIFRYKRRLIMTLVGIAGCSALILTAFGLNDSIKGVTDLQYDEIIKYDNQAYLKEITKSEQKDELDAILPERHLYIHEEAVTAGSKSGSLSASMIAPEYPEKLNEYYDLYDPVTFDSIHMTDKSVLVTEKLARVMDLGVGEEFIATLSDGRQYSLEITGIVDNYIQHYIYISPDNYDKMIGDVPEVNGVLIFDDNDRDHSKSVLENENVRALIHNDDVRSMISDSADAMGIVTIVLMVLACSLALVVLFNLTIINIAERVRELATMKVLGLNDLELNMYVFRENAIVTILGILLGLLGGIALHSYVLTSVEIDALKFPQIIDPQSYIIAVLLSMGFAVFVNLVMSLRIDRIDMVESLKGVE